MKHREQNTGFCYIPDAKFPGGFCDLAGFGLRFLIKSCTSPCPGVLGGASQVRKQMLFPGARRTWIFPLAAN